MEETAGEFRPGMVCCGGKLYLFDRSGVTVVRPWGPPMAWRRTKTQPWRHVRPALFTLAGAASLAWEDAEGDAAGASVDADAEKRVSPIVEAFSVVPQEVRAVVAAFSERHFALLAFAHSCGDPGLELLRSNPALGFMVATNWIWHKPAVKRPQRSARSLVRKKRRDILAWLGFPRCGEAEVRILGRIPAADVRVQMLFYLREALGNPAVVRALGFTPLLNRHVLRVAADQALFPCTAPSLLGELSRIVPSSSRSENRATRGPNGRLTSAGSISAEAGWKAIHEMGDTLRMYADLGRAAAPPCFRSIDQVERLHHEATLAHRREIGRRYLGAEFPPPPLPGVENIIPVTTPEMLLAESLEMGHCVDSYAGRILDGGVYIYRVTHPERATVSVVSRGGWWRLEDCLGPGNAAVGQDTKYEVLQWLAKTQEGLPSAANTLIGLENLGICAEADGYAEEDDTPF